MKLSQILLTVLIVAGSIAVYDVVIRDGDPGGAPAELTVLRETVYEEAEPEILAPITLEGRGDDLRVEELERRLAALEQSFTNGDRVVVVAEGSERGTDRATSPAAPASASEPDGDEQERDPEDPDALNPRPAPVEELRDFRRKLQWVERQRKLEKQARDLSQWLDAQGVTLTNEQRWEVVREAMRYRARAGRILKEQGADVSPEEKQAVVRSLTSEFKDRLYDMVPPGEAGRIVDAIDRAGAKAEAARRAKEGR